MRTLSTAAPAAPRIATLGLVPGTYEMPTRTPPGLAALWPDAARYVARINDDPMHHSVSVKLFRYCEDIQLPGAKPAANSETIKPEDFFTYEVKPGDLQ